MSMATTSSAIALSRVAIWYQDTQVDLALPTRAPISDYIDDVVDTFSDQVDIEARRSGQWTLARLDRPCSRAVRWPTRAWPTGRSSSCGWWPPPNATGR
ncbi:WXG100 secretion system (Wss), YukD family protein [Mycobacterium xenopi 4042]|uniref:WXG100 secretion system (Wss), YukD family protein n=1 Tax=Mycobacterium xenopi 4042 TaxID=1299334 RepID=X7YS57_MYCXE|nr:WXG100 secretion system (Wss), YukD family protein [Mycobacterium xenopi 4042]